MFECSQYAVWRKGSETVEVCRSAMVASIDTAACKTAAAAPLTAQFFAVAAVV
jgi:hypothetical protein